MGRGREQLLSALGALGAAQRAFLASLGFPCPIHQMCHIFHQALPVAAASSGAELLPVGSWEFGISFSFNDGVV